MYKIFPLWVLWVQSFVLWEITFYIGVREWTVRESERQRKLNPVGRMQRQMILPEAES